MFGGAYESSCIFNNMGLGGPDLGGGTVAERLPARSPSVPAVVRWICQVSNYDEIAHDLDAGAIGRADDET